MAQKEVVIQLRGDRKALQDGDNQDESFKAIHNEFSSRYLEALGVTPTPATKAMVLKHAPVHECQVSATWENRAVESITIVPRACGGKADAQEAKPPTGRQSSFDIEEALAAMKFEHISVALPSDPLTTIKKGKERDVESEKIQHMRLKDLVGSEGINPELVAELERVRVNVRKAFHAEPTEEQGSVTARLAALGDELEELKGRFIVPFSCVKGDALVAWHDPRNGTPLDGLDMSEELRLELASPLTVTGEQVAKELSTYVDRRLPLELLTAPPPDGQRRWEVELREQKMRQMDELRERLKGLGRIVGLFGHLLYWSVFGGLPVAGLPSESRQKLVVAIYGAWSDAERGQKDKARGGSFELPAVVLTLKRMVLWCFTQEYPKFAASAEMVGELAARMNVLFMRVLDTECRFARFPALDATPQAAAIYRRLAKAGHRPQLAVHRSTPLVRSVLEQQATDPRSRRLLARGGKDAKEQGVARGITDDNRAQLMRVAMNRLGPNCAAISEPKARRQR